MSGLDKLDEAWVPNDGVLYKELEYRRRRQWEIFSWCSTLLVAITGGLIALQTRQQASPFHLGQKISISLAVLVLAAYAVFWIVHNNYLEMSIKGCFDPKFHERICPHKHLATGYVAAIVILGIAALWATWYSQ